LSEIRNGHLNQTRQLVVFFTSSFVGEPSGVADHERNSREQPTIESTVVNVLVERSLIQNGGHWIPPDWQDW
jgi:hypothetical protein